MTWKPIETAPKDSWKLYKMHAVGAWKHKTYGWLWGPLKWYTDKHHEDGGYFIASHGEPTHWTRLQMPEEN